jgi:ligand-binding sensor domain-containing protein
MVKRLTLFFASFFIWNSLVPQNFIDQNFLIKTYTVDQGLPNNHVRSIAQDQNGFIWILTWDAVSRYDGYEFKNFYNDPKDSTSAPGMDNRQMICDKYNTIWITNPFGLWQHDRKTSSFIPFSSIDKLRFTMIALDPVGNLWIQDDKRLFIIKDSCMIKEVIAKSKNGHKFDSNFGQFVIDNEHNIWALRNDTIFYFKFIQTNGNESYLYEEINRYPFYQRTLPNNLTIDFTAFKARKSCVISGNLGLLINDTVIDEYRQLINIEEIQELPKFFFGWNELNNCLHLFNEGKPFFTYQPKESGIVQTWLVDKNKFIWLGIYKSNGEGNGLTKIMTPSHLFNHYLTENDIGERLGILSILKDSDNNIWIGTIGNNFLYHLRIGQKPEKCISLNKKLLPPYIHSRSLIEFNGKILAGNSYDLMYCFDPTSKRINYLYPGIMQRILPDNLTTFKFIVKNKYENLTIAGSSGIVILNTEMNKVLFSENKWEKGDIYSVINDCDTNYWLGSNGYLMFFNKRLTNRIIYSVADKKYNIESIIEGDSNHLWLALLGGGICRFNKATGESEIFSTQHGLKNSTCYNLLQDKHGHIWVSTNQGISMFNPETRRFRNFGEAEGLQIVEFNADAVWHGEDDEMMFGGMGGFVSFYPDSIENMTNDYYAPLLVTELKVSGISYYQNVYELKKVKLEKGMDNFQLAFACLDFMNADKLFYRYRLMENDTGWIETDSRKRYANYINLSPGVYHFKVQVTDANGNWKADKEASLELEIPAFYYQTILFKAASGATGIALVIFSILMYIRHLKLKEKRKRELLLHEEEVKREQLKLEALRGQLNPHFIFNSLNSVNDFILDNDPMKANQYLTDFAGLMRSFLDNSKREFIPLIKEIELLEHYLKLEQIRYSDRFEFEIDYDEVQNIYSEISPSMVQPFVENAVWHGIGKMGKDYSGKIRLVFRQEHPDCIICNVEDNGIGISGANAMKSDQQKKRQSRGISIIQERLDIINSTRNTRYSIRLEELNPGMKEPGTRVRIDIPVKHVIAESKD